MTAPYDWAEQPDDVDPAPDLWRCGVCAWPGWDVARRRSGPELRHCTRCGAWSVEGVPPPPQRRGRTARRASR